MCDVATRAGARCSRVSSFWVQVELPPRITDIDGDLAGRSLLACAQHLPAAVRSISDCQRELLAGTVHPLRPVTVKRGSGSVYVF